MTTSDSAHASPENIRARVRAGEWRGPTTGACRGWLQANLAILPGELAGAFHAACEANPRALPLLERTSPGVADSLRIAPGADLRTDLSGYQVHRHGVAEESVSDLTELWRSDMVGFLLGCSFSAEDALLSAGVTLRHLTLGQGVPVFKTNVECVPSGPFRGPMVVSMRPIATEQLQRAREVTEQLPLAHGGPVHEGDPAALGITDLDAPDWGDPIDVLPGETPVFWACGVTPRTLIAAAAPELAITHAPGHMFLTDIAVRDVLGRSSVP